jgi:hypothetical protein
MERIQIDQASSLFSLLSKVEKQVMAMSSKKE